MKAGRGSARRKLSGVGDDADALASFSRVRVSMVLTDPRTGDNPIVYVNAAFERTTGYARSAVIGRNCRFLRARRPARHRWTASEPPSSVPRT